MLLRSLFLLIACCTILQAKRSIDPSSVAILYNSNSPESSKLAHYYAKKRNIPNENIIALATSTKEEISREEYNQSIRDPLWKHFDSHSWWRISTSSDGFSVPTKNKIRLLVCMYGMPFKVRQVASPTGQPQKGGDIQKSNCASVDSELTVFGIKKPPIQGAIPNHYFKKNDYFSNIEKMTPFFLVGRIDGPSYKIAQRLIDDAIATEKQGLWGMCYLDKAHKGKGYKMGDQWLTNIEKRNWELGLPTTMDDNPQTYLTNYPMRDVSLYYGWYTTHRNGPFLAPKFRLKRGAVAVHMHSFSAQKLRNPNTHWTGPLLAKGAAATVGNVYEPYLQLSHHFDILHQRLLKGYTFIEAASMALPYLSWQNVAIGDPLYQPFRHLNGSGTIADEDKLYRASSIALKIWGDTPKRVVQKLTTAAIKTKDARYYEILGLWKNYLGDTKAATGFFYPAINTYKEQNDKVRISLHLANLYRATGNKKQAIDTLENAIAQYKKSPARKTAQAMLNIVNPPPPPVAKPRKNN